MTRSADRPTVLFTALRGFALFSSRLQLMQQLQSMGMHVVAATTDDPYLQRIQNAGITTDVIPYARGNIKPVADAKAITALRRIIHQYQPKLIHCFQPKPLVFTALATPLPKDCHLVTTITGLGALHNLLGKPFIGAPIRYLLARALRRCDRVIFQNPDDMTYLKQLQLLDPDRSRLILSSGVDLSRFAEAPDQFTDQPQRILMAARLLWDKGVKEYAQAAAICKARHPRLIFELAGEADTSHHNGVDQAWLDQQRPAIEPIGYIKDMPGKLRDIDLFVLPSYYREGLPRVLLEAAAASKPVITTDWPGCRDAIEPERTGLLVPPRNPEALAQAICRLVEQPDLYQAMAQAARPRVAEQFDLAKIIQQYINVYRETGALA